MERVCRTCGRVYRGLVCHACHPRKAKAEDEVKAKFEADCAGNQRSPKSLRVMNELTSHDDEPG